jgi:hypothetical protein
MSQTRSREPSCPRTAADVGRALCPPALASDFLTKLRGWRLFSTRQAQTCQTTALLRHPRRGIASVSPANWEGGYTRNF